MSAPSPRLGWIATAGFLLLMLLHLDFWSGGWAGLDWGWVPGELVYRLSWIGAAWLYLIFFCRVIWRDGDES